MHEIGALTEAVKMAQAAAEENGVERIAAVLLEVGELSGILPVFLEKYYPIVIEGNELFRDSQLQIEQVPGRGMCLDCQSVYNVMRFEGACPKCGSRAKTILSGQDFVLKSITPFQK